MNPFNLPLSRLGSALLLALASVACSSVAGTGAPVKAAAPAAPLLQQIQAEIGDAACDSAAQCRTIALGSKACGGPERYLAWSNKRTDGAKLGRLAEQHAAARQAENAKSDMMSTCDMVMDPGATCQQQRCVLLPRSPGGGASLQN